MYFSITGMKHSPPPRFIQCRYSIIIVGIYYCHPNVRNHEVVTPVHRKQNNKIFYVVLNVAYCSQYISPLHEQKNIYYVSCLFCTKCSVCHIKLAKGKNYRLYKLNRFTLVSREKFNLAFICL